ncbi:MAG: sigma-E processing peptidase SpoIIGA [Bacilli bacterium]|nr:sigma-E processing peptidase SpoIIGA [Bacilli bacterium]MBQ6282685.1 sigma-E processing peptidase SpoIIGA [Bacilli bacterium]
MKVYIDVIFFINIFFDFILLLSVSLILRRNVKIYKIILGSIVGGISILFLFLPINKITLFFLKIIIAILMCITAFNYKDIKYTIKNIIFLYLISVLLGGALYLLNIEFSYKNNGLIFYHNGLSINIILIIIVTPIILYFYVKEMKDLKNNYSKYYKVNIYFKSKKNILLNGFLDTGNNLIDPYKKRPIIIVNYNKIRKYVLNEKELLVPYSNINNNSIMRCIKVNKVVINDVEYKNILLGFSINKIRLDGIDCILNNNMEGLC